MKFQQPSWDSSPQSWAEYRTSYSLHLSELQDKLPNHVLKLSELQGVDDALIAEVYYERPNQFFRLTLRCGDLQMGYYDSVLSYVDAEISKADELLITQIVQQEIDLRRFELDITDDGRIEQRFEFHSGDITRCWFAIRSRSLSWKTVNKVNRNLPELEDRLLKDITG